MRERQSFAFTDYQMFAHKVTLSSSHTHASLCNSACICLSHTVNTVYLLCCTEGQSEVLLSFTGFEGGEVKSRGKEAMDECTESQAVTPRGREVFYADTL